MKHLTAYDLYESISTYVCSEPLCASSRFGYTFTEPGNCPKCESPLIPGKGTRSPEPLKPSTPVPAPLRPYSPNKNADFSKSLVKEIVWRVGEIKDSPEGGGIWFAETKEGAENFSISVRRKAEKANPYRINLQNPFQYDRFWHGYLTDVERKHKYSRESLMRDLESKGYDGIIIDTDTWNDTGDEYAVTSKQYVVFDPSNVKPA